MPIQPLNLLKPLTPCCSLLDCENRQFIERVNELHVHATSMAQALAKAGDIFRRYGQRLDELERADEPQLTELGRRLEPHKPEEN